MFDLKDYQKRALDTLSVFLERSDANPTTDNLRHAFLQTLADQGISSNRYLAPAGLENVPYVCLRLPTGGGKTVLAAYAIERLASGLRQTEAPLVLWLVPSNTIREQTLTALQTPGHPYRQSIELHYGQPLVVDLSDIELARPQDFGHRLIVAVGTLASLLVNDVTGRKIYAHSEKWEEHFERFPAGLLGLDRIEAGPHKGQIKKSFVNLCHQYHPFVVIDEAHNARGPLRSEVLERISPAVVLELSATPDTDAKTGSNVLYSVSASELKAENMIKLPILLTEHATWQAAAGASVRERERLEMLAREEPGEYLRPITLFQAENKDKEITVERLKQHLIDNEGIAPEQIAIATGTTREIDGVDLFSPQCPIRHIITVQALKEGWDCSLAWVFCSVADIKSAKDVEQLLGRVLRLPYARRKTRAELNQAYAHVRSASFSEAAAHLKDRLCAMGFEDAEAALYIDPAAGYLVPPEEGVQLAQDGIDPFGQSLTFKPVHPVVATSIPDSVVNYVKLFTRPDGQQVVKIAGHLTVEVQNALVQAFALEGATVERNIRNLYRVQMAYQPRASAASGFSVPTLEVFDRQLGLAYPLEAEVFAEFGNWSLSGAPALLDEAAFPTAQEKQTSSFDVRLGNTGKTEVRYDQVAANATDEWKLPFFEHGSDFELNNLIFWLDRQLARTDLGQLDLHAWLRRVIDALREKRGLALADVLVLKYRLLTALKRQLTRLHQASSAAGQALLFDAPPDHVEIRWNHAFAFDPFQPPYHKPEPLAGSGFQFAKHLYLVIQDMKRSGEEFECAVALDQSPAVAKWVRNVPLHPKSFWLPMADGRFFPDFVAQLTDGRVMVVEYKGDMLATNDDSKEKQRVGQLWEKVSGGQGVFLWAVKAGPQGELVAQQIAGKVDE